MTDFKHKRFAVASGLAVAAIIAMAVAIYIPYSASAQQMMTASPAWMGQGSNVANLANHTQMMPNINGSISVPKLISDQIKVSFSDAAKTAEGQVDGGKVVGGHIGVVNGYLVYSFMVSKPDTQTSYKVIVDAGNGSVLYKSDGFHMGSFGDHFGFRGGPWNMNRFGSMMSKHLG